MVGRIINPTNRILLLSFVDKFFNNYKHLLANPFNEIEYYVGKNVPFNDEVMVTFESEDLYLFFSFNSYKGNVQINPSLKPKRPNLSINYFQLLQNILKDLFPFFSDCIDPIMDIINFIKEDDKYIHSIKSVVVEPNFKINFVEPTTLEDRKYSIKIDYTDVYKKILNLSFMFLSYSKVIVVNSELDIYYKYELNINYSADFIEVISFYHNNDIYMLNEEIINKEDLLNRLSLNRKTRFETKIKKIVQPYLGEFNFIFDDKFKEQLDLINMIII